MKIELSLQILEKSTNIKFYENPSNGIRDVPRGQADRHTDSHDEASSRFPQFCETA
jgi:hypothetical protein